MDPSSDIIVDTPYFRIYGDRRIDRLVGTDTVPAGFDPTTGVTSKDVVVDRDTGIYVRLYLPDTAAGSDDSKKLPVLVYFHGGGFVVNSAACPHYQPFLNTLAACRAGRHVGAEKPCLVNCWRKHLFTFFNLSTVEWALIVSLCKRAHKC